MAELRRDPILGRWGIINTDNPVNLDDFEKEQHEPKKGLCVFCYGNEDKTPIEIEAFRLADTKPNTPGWTVRVIPNKFPALQIEGSLDKRGLGIFDLSNGIGAHEVIVDTPYHDKNIPELEITEVRDILYMYSRRAMDLIKDKRFKYIMIFKNYGSSAGASLEHPHSQLIALPMVPKNASEELYGAQKYFEFRGRCIFCDMISQERKEKKRIVFENDDYVAFCPFVPRFSFETWILPKKHHASLYKFADSADKLDGLALILKEVLSRLKICLQDPAYNYIIHCAPSYLMDSVSYHWHIEIIPKLTRVAGFEWGTGFYIVSFPPELSAAKLREIK